MLLATIVLRKEHTIKNKRLSACELTTMKCLWDIGPMTAKCIVERLDNEYGVKCDESTVVKFLEKLLQIGFVKCCGKYDRYYMPVKEEKDFQQEQQRAGVKFGVNGRINRFVSGL